jgi:Na+-driven multidrug efflux pump
VHSHNLTNDSEFILASTVRLSRVRAIGVPFSLLNTTLSGAFRGLLDTRTPLQVAVIANILNFFLDLTFIFGFSPAFPGLGAPGAAAASVFAEATATFLLLRGLRNSPIFPHMLALPDVKEVGGFVGASAAVLCRTAALQSTLLLAASVVSRNGTAPDVAAHQVSDHALLCVSFSSVSMNINRGIPARSFTEVILTNHNLSSRGSRDMIITRHT